MCSPTKGRLGSYLNTMISDLCLFDRGEYLRQLFGKFHTEVVAAEYAESQKPTTNTQRDAIAPLPKVPADV